MKIYNVAVPVVELVSAASEAEAISDLKDRLMSAGFDPYEGEIVTSANAFESEELNQPVAEAVASTSDQWHDNCPRCPHCGKHRHGGSCSPLLDAAREAQALNEPIAATHDPYCDDGSCTTCFPQAAVRRPYEVQELNEGQFWAISGDPGKAEQLGPYATRAEADLAGLKDIVADRLRRAGEPVTARKMTALLCDECREAGTGLAAECQDVCNMPLEHDGECADHWTGRVQVTCDRCGDTGRLTREDVTNLDFS